MVRRKDFHMRSIYQPVRASQGPVTQSSEELLGRVAKEQSLKEFVRSETLLNCSNSKNYFSKLKYRELK